MPPITPRRGRRYVERRAMAPLLPLLLHIDGADDVASKNTD